MPTSKHRPKKVLSQREIERRKMQDSARMPQSRTLKRGGRLGHETHLASIAKRTGN